MPSFQDNFGTNQTSNTLAGATTTPLNSIPAVDAPYFIALDATNINSHYEVVYVTSDTATNINHAATTYAHTTAEEVRMIVPANYLNAMQQMQEGGTLNIKFVPSVASDNLTVALKGLDGNDHSATNPGYVMIGGTLRTITSALTFTRTAGGNYFNAGSAEFATKEIDYFVYLYWRAASSEVGLAMCRIPYANLISDVDVSDGLNEKWFNYNTALPASTDVVVNIGRFAATLSAGAGYTWTVPTFTASNLIQRPIYETRWLSYQPVYTCSGSMTYGTVTTTIAKYKVSKNCEVLLHASGTTGGTASYAIYASLPFTQANLYGCMAGAIYDVAWLGTGFIDIANSGKIAFAKISIANWALAADKRITCSGFYEI